MSVVKLLAALDKARNLGDNLCIMGPSGAGKSQLVEQYGASIGVNVHTHLLYGDPISVLGIPKLGSEFTEFQKSMLLKCEEGDIIFLDEITNCHINTVSVMWTALSGGEIGGHKFPANIQFVLAGNMVKHSQAAKDLPKPLIGRIVMHEYNGPTADEMLDFTTKHDWHPVLRAFLHKSPDMLIDPKVKDDQEPFYCPRQWYSVSKLLNMYWTDGVEPDDLVTDIVSRVGQVAFQRLKVYLDMGTDLLDVADILGDPSNISLDTFDTDQKIWLQLYGLVSYFEPDNYVALSKFLMRMKPENQIMFIKLLDTKTLGDWVMNEECKEYTDKMMADNEVVWNKVVGRTFD